MQVNNSSFWQCKSFVDIRRFLLGRLQTCVRSLKSTNLPFSRCHIFVSFRNNIGINCTECNTVSWATAEKQRVSLLYVKPYRFVTYTARHERNMALSNGWPWAIMNPAEAIAPCGQSSWWSDVISLRRQKASRDPTIQAPRSGSGIIGSPSFIFAPHNSDLTRLPMISVVECCSCSVRRRKWDTKDSRL